MKVLDLTEFYSQRGGGVRSHLSVKTHVLCQLGHSQRLVVPGPGDHDEPAGSSTPGEPMLTKVDATGGAPVARDAPQISSQIHGSVEHETLARRLTVRGPAMPYDPSYHLLYRVDKVRAIVRRERPDVLEIHSPYVAAVAALGCPRSSYGVRTFVWHSDFVDTYRAVFERRARWAGPAFARVGAGLWAWARHIAQGCARTFVASAFLADKLRAHGLPRVECLPFGVDKALFSPALRTADARAALAARFGIAPEVPLAALIGRFAIEKHTDLTLRAFGRVLRRATPRPHLLAYGDGPERAALEALVGRDPLLARHVHFTGFEKSRTRLAQDLANVDVLLHACPYETFGLGVAEALATGVAAVLPNAGGTATWSALPSVVSYRPLDEHALTEGALSQLARTPEQRRRAGDESRAAIASERDHFVALCDRYEELLAHHPYEIR